MHRKIPTLALLLSLAASARADTFLWSGTDGNFSDPASWTGPTPTGSPTDQLLFPAPADPTATTYVATIDKPGPWTLNTLTFAPATLYETTISLNAAPGASLLFSGPNAAITVLPTDTYNNPTINSPITSTSDLTLAGSGLTLNGPLSFSNNSNLTVTGYVEINTSAPAGLKQLIVTGASPDMAAGVVWNIPLPDAAAVSFGTRPIILTNGYFDLKIPFMSPFNPVTITNSFVINSSAQLQGGGIFSGGVSVVASGTIFLNGTLTTVIESDISLTGDIVLGPGAAITAGDGILPIDGNIVDAPTSSTARKPLFISAPIAGEIFGYHPGVYINGAANTYSGGTEIGPGFVHVAANSCLGLGDVTIDAGATLSLAAPTNIASNAKIFVSQNAALAISFDQDPSRLLNPTSAGVLDLDTQFSQSLNMATIGNGFMTLGSTSNGTYAASARARRRQYLPFRDIRQRQEFTHTSYSRPHRLPRYPHPCPTRRRHPCRSQFLLRRFHHPRRRLRFRPRRTRHGPDHHRRPASPNSHQRPSLPHHLQRLRPHHARQRLRNPRRDRPERFHPLINCHRTAPRQHTNPR